MNLNYFMIKISRMNLFQQEKQLSFQVSTSGTIGVTSTATFTLSYSDFNPEKLFYNVDRKVDILAHRYRC